ncbi:hypothetical protein SEA_SCENTAE_126 [Gordonia phage SCentae]|nr:hypothetical protein SEA_SCENTAE_126 [Gordonia phage SCentae]
MAQGETVIDFITDFQIEFGSQMFVPLDTEILNVTTEGNTLIFQCHCVYDYGPFADAYAPPFEFQALLFQVTLFGEFVDPQEVTCISSPSGDGSRVTTSKE